MSPGIRSGVNWMRLKDRSRHRASVLIIKVLARPGTPSSRQWPRAKMAMSISSITLSWPDDHLRHFLAQRVVGGLQVLDRIQVAQVRGDGRRLRRAGALGAGLRIAPHLHLTLPYWSSCRLKLRPHSSHFTIGIALLRSPNLSRPLCAKTGPQKRASPARHLVRINAYTTRNRKNPKTEIRNPK